MPASSTTRNFRLALAAFAALLAMGAAAGAAASGDTPTPTAEPTPTASPTPYPQSTITVRFVRDGEPVELVLTTPVYRILAEGVACAFPIPAEVTTADSYTISWPLFRPDIGAAPECMKGPPVALTFEFIVLVLGQSPFPTISVSFTWAGGPAEVSLEVPLHIPIAGPTVSPYPPTVITVNFVTHGEPLAVRRTLVEMTADGVLCNFSSALGSAPTVQPTSFATLTWPPQEGGSPDACYKGPPTQVRFVWNSEYGPLEVSVAWTGVDITRSVEVPILSSPTPSVNALPRSGGGPAPATEFPNWIDWIAWAGFCLIFLGAVALRMSTRRR